MTIRRAFFAAGIAVFASLSHPAVAQADRKAEIGALVDAAADNFQTIRGDLKAGKATVWKSSIAPAGMSCDIEDATDQGGINFTSLTCWALDDFSDAETEAMADSVKGAFRDLFPSWVWARSVDEHRDGSTTVFFGPSENEFHVLFEQGQGEYGPYFSFRVDNLSYSVPYAVEMIAAP